ncbi:MAG TPA: putative metal-binding motif-containing protein, partial [Candidatus Polarisedimenticolia bacterium]|nr:putative metal-binding motif-containing protein [Candidatus Polarisedimenticolia bacterium]
MRSVSLGALWIPLAAAVMVMGASVPEAAVCTPGAPEICNGLDDDCDGIADEDPACSTACWPGLENPLVPAPGGAPSYAPSLAWDGAGYGWVGGTFTFDRRSADGQPLGAPVSLPLDVFTPASDFRGASIVWTGTEYGVAWGDTQIHFLRLDASGQPIGPLTTLPNPLAWVFFSADLAWTGTEYGLVWAETPSTFMFPDERILFARFDAPGTLLGAPRVL